GLVQLWRLTGKPQAVAFQAKDAVFAVALSADGKTLAAGTGGGTVRVWDVATRKELAALRPKAGGIVRALAFAPDGKPLASGHGQGVAAGGVGERGPQGADGDRGRDGPPAAGPARPRRGEGDQGRAGPGGDAAADAPGAQKSLAPGPAGARRAGRQAAGGSGS